MRLNDRFLAVLLMGLLLAADPVAAQNNEGDTSGEVPGDYGWGGYDYWHGSHDGCADACTTLPGAEGATERVLRTEGARYEHVLIGPRQQAEAARQAIEAAGGTVIRTRDLDGLGQTLQVATFPGVAAFDRARGLVAERAAQSSLSLHHLYGFAQSRGAPRLYAPALIGETGPGRCPVARPITIGMIDGPVNTDHPVFRGASVTYESLVPAGPQPGADHGTAVAALLVGQDGSGALAGFAQGARLHAISVFSDRDAREEASVERIAQALDRMVQSGIGLINLSIAGPENPALGRALQAAAAQGVVLVGASGNDRRPAVAWPAASPDVIAVTAVDAARRRFRMANTGAQIEFSAPGVDVYAARAQGAGYVSGTSFATPIVTALVARQMARGVRSSAAIRAALRAGVETLGPGSRNTEFGWGLVKASGC